MLHIVNRVAGRPANAVLRAMFAARKLVFVDLLGWDVPVLEGRYEIDQFDDEHATYLILTDTVGGHLASARLLPTTRPHILGDLYPDLCDDAPPRGDAIYEVTRFCVDPALRAHERRQVRDTLVATLAEHALAHGIDHYSAIAEIGWFQQILSFGWTCQPLGLPRILCGSMLVAFQIDIDADTPARLAASGIRSVSLDAVRNRAAA